MALDAKRPACVMISDTLTGKHADPSKWLGRFVRTRSKPSDEYAPEDKHNPAGLIESFILDASPNTDATMFTKALNYENL